MLRSRPLHGGRHLVAFMREANRRFCATTFIRSGAGESTEELYQSIQRSGCDGIALMHNVRLDIEPALIDRVTRLGIPLLP